MPTAVRSHAKINLGLGIGAPRADGFHALVTVYQTLAVHDWVTVTASPAVNTKITLTSNDERVPCDSRNTAWKMVELALSALDMQAEVTVHIEKRLPVQGGLGAGSANAVAALLGLEAELKIPVTPEWGAKRLEIAAKVGSDVPLFLIGGAVLGLDRGQQVYPLPDLEETWCVVATPSVGVSTPQAFRDWDALCEREGLTQIASDDKLDVLSRVYAASFAGGRVWDGSSGVSGLEFEGHEGDLAGPQVSALVRTGIANDFERVVFLQHPLLSEIKRVLAAPGTPEEALHASLSGSGSALFGLYRGQRDAEAALSRLRAMEVEGILTRTFPRALYWQGMLRQM
ncbi:MAG TPA: 4-(cytidine 5'-diphospho)-2-C-methyl-D-erythritol kinase [Acidobacteriaceae bacterium]